MLRAVTIVLALVLSQGWQWAKLLEDQEILDKQGAAIVAIGFGILFLAQQWILTLNEPVERSVVRERSVFVEAYLGQLLKEYYAILVAQNANDVAQPVVRVNVMLPVVDRWRMRQRLQICYKSCPDGVQYRFSELDLYWSKHNGVVGWVWSRGEPQHYSAGRQDTRSVTQSLTPEQKRAVSHLRSVVSVPILHNGTPVGVLTLDGQEDVDRTRFGSQPICDHLKVYASRLPSLCFPQGIKPR